MLYPSHIADKLGFTEIKNHLKDCCLSDMGRKMVEGMRFMSRFEELNKLLRQTDEFKRILENDDPFPSSNYLPLKELAMQVKTEGAFLPEEDLLAMSLALKTIFDILNYCTSRIETYPLLNQFIADIPVEKSLLRDIEKVIDETGKLRPDASPEYSALTRQISGLERDARRKVDQQYKEAQKQGWSGDGSLTVRDGRMCIPILAEYKRKLKGYIHDESATGQTVYLEPAEVFEINNQLRDLEFEKRREKIRILKQVAAGLREFFPLLLSYHSMLSKIDFIRAKAVLAGMLDASLPEVHDSSACRILRARHPLLYLNFKKSGGQVVPLDLEMDINTRMVLVSGPNAGGKSVCLKTIGLLQLMLQSGLLIPVDASSSFGIYQKILVDIGDEQSIESDLSTYSAHLGNMKLFVEKSDDRTLVLIDEFGTGTDPQFGGPIAEAVLQVLNEKKVRGIITTHYSNLKIFAGSQEGLVNASMLFDTVHLQPLYKLEVGKPGSSYAFEIARKIGLPQRVLDLAWKKIGEEQKRIEHLLISLEKDQVKLVNQEILVGNMQRKLAVLLEENETLQTFLDDNRKKLLTEAKKEAEYIIRNANKLVESTINDIKVNKADKDLTRLSRQKLEVELEKLKPAEVKVTETLIPEKKEELKEGDWVLIEGQDNPGRIISTSRDNAVIAMGELRTVVKLKRLTRLDKKEEKKIARSSYLNHITENMIMFSPELDVRGRRGEDALNELERFLDRALMLNISNLKIIHGKGDGILRKMIREYLKKFPVTSRVEDEHADRGGDGITYVYFQAH